MIDRLFRGYVPTKNKRCLRKFKDAPLMTLDEVSNLEEYAGILAEDIVLIDIDDAEQSDIMMGIVEDMSLDCAVIKTSRGRHFYFRNPKRGGIEKCATHARLACGLTADIKMGAHNSYAVLRYEGADRAWEWDADKIQEVPRWLYPVKSNLDLFALQEGDGRNQALYNYILTLTSAGFSKDDTREVLTMVNKYVFSVPLSDSELEVIMRDDAFPSDSFFKDKKFLHDKFADYLMRNDYIYRVNGQLHIYKDGVYIPAQRMIEGAMLKHIPFLKTNQRNEVLRYMNIRAEEKQPADARYIAFRNGVYDMTSEKLLPFSPERVITNQIPWNYNENAYNEAVDKTLNKIACNDEKIRHLLEECIGYCFYRRAELSKFFILTGEKNNGKSTFLEMVKTLLGEDNVSALDLEDMNERFAVASMFGKLANIGDDISDEFLHGRGVSMLKKVVSGNMVKAEFKGQDAFFFNPYVKLLFSANDIPRTKDKTGAVLRRMVIIPFNARFTKEDPDYDPYIVYKLKTEEAMEYLVQIGLDGLFDVLQNNAFTESEKVDKAIEEYNEENNPILLFIKDAEIVGRFTKDCYKEYQTFCIENGYTQCTFSMFTRQIKQKLRVTVKKVRISGKTLDKYVEF